MAQPRNIHFDSALTKKFFTIPKRNEAEGEEVNFPLPAAPKDIRVFIDKHGKVPEEGKYEVKSNSDEAFYRGVKSIVADIQQWIADNYSDGENVKGQLIQKLDAFLYVQFKYHTGDENALKQFYPLYSEGVRMLKKISIALTKDTFYIETRKKILTYMVLSSSGLSVCARGAYSNIYDAYMKLAVSKAEILMSIRHNIVAQTAELLVNKHAQWDEHLKDNEVEMTNAVINAHAATFGLHSINDGQEGFLTRQDEIGVIVRNAISKLPEEVAKILKPELVLENIFLGANLSELIEEYGKTFQSSWINHIHATLDLYGEDKGFADENLSIELENYERKIKNPAEVNLYITQSFMHRLEKEGELEIKREKFTDGEVEINLASQRDLSFSYVECAGVRKPFISYIIDQVRPSEYVEEYKPDLGPVSAFAMLKEGRQRADVIRQLLLMLQTEEEIPYLQILLKKVLFTSVNKSNPGLMDAALYLKPEEFHKMLQHLSAKDVEVLVKQQNVLQLWSQLPLDLSVYADADVLSKIVDPIIAYIANDYRAYNNFLQSETRDGNTILHVIAKLYRNDKDQVRKDQLEMLIANRVRINKDNHAGFTATYIAAMNSNWDCVDALFEETRKIIEIERKKKRGMCEIKKLDLLLVPMVSAGRWDLVTKAFHIMEYFVSGPNANYLRQISNNPEEYTAALALAMLLKPKMPATVSAIFNAIVECSDSVLSNVFMYNGLENSNNLYILFTHYNAEFVIESFLEKINAHALNRSLLMPIEANSRSMRGMSCFTYALAHFDADMLDSLLSKATVNENTVLANEFINTKGRSRQYLEFLLQNKDIRVLEVVKNRLGATAIGTSLLSCYPIATSIMADKANANAWFAKIIDIISVKPFATIIAWTNFSRKDAAYLSKDVLFTIASSLYKGVEGNRQCLEELLTSPSLDGIYLEEILWNYVDFNQAKQAIDKHQQAISINLLNENVKNTLSIFKLLLGSSSNNLHNKIMLYTILSQQNVPGLVEACGFDSVEKAVSHLEMEIKVGLVKQNIAMKDIADQIINPISEGLKSANHNLSFYQIISQELQTSLSSTPQLTP